MTESARTLVRWPRVGNSTQWSKWHVLIPIPADDEGQTACGWRYSRRGVEHKPHESTDTICLNCRRALQGTVPERPT